MQNGTDIWAFAGIVLLCTAAICTTVYLLERWLLGQAKPRIRRAPRVHKTKKARYEPSAPARRTVYPDGREEVMK